MPLGPLPAEELTLEFLCGQAVSIKAGQNQTTIYGTYDSNDLTAVFQDLTLHIDGVSVVFVDADRSGDILYLRWRISDSPDTFTTSMHRLSAYPS